MGRMEEGARWRWLEMCLPHVTKENAGNACVVHVTCAEMVEEGEEEEERKYVEERIPGRKKRISKIKERKNNGKKEERRG